MYMTRLPFAIPSINKFIRQCRHWIIVQTIALRLLTGRCCRYRRWRIQHLALPIQLTAVIAVVVRQRLATRDLLQRAVLIPLCCILSFVHISPATVRARRIAMLLMHWLVDHQGSRLAKPLAAHGTLERLLFRVDVPVVAQVVLSAEGLAADVARVGTLVCVGSFVDKKVVGLGEVTLTESTDVLFSLAFSTGFLLLRLLLWLLVVIVVECLCCFFIQWLEGSS